MKVNIKKLNAVSKIPTRGSADAAGYDLYAGIAKENCIAPHTTVATCKLTDSPTKPTYNLYIVGIIAPISCINGYRIIS